jgi:aminocarboxymuconate-semialdehyde decarboxylase
MKLIDAHAHLFPTAWQDLGRMPPDMFDVERQLERMETGGIATSVISDPHIWYGDLDLGDVANARTYNDFVADLAREHPGRFVGLATVTPWRGDEHLAEARRAVEELGIAGFAVATSDRECYLDTVPDGFWELAIATGAPVFVHPGGKTVGQELLTSYRLGEVCGRPLDMTVTLARFILTGTSERLPELRLLCAHAGGAICMIADRLDFGHELRNYAPLGPWGDVELSEPPSRHIARLYLDTVTFGPNPLRLALAAVGSERLCFGTDCPPVPFDVARHLAVVDALALDEPQRAAVLAGNARRLFGIEGDPA